MKISSEVSPGSNNQRAFVFDMDGVLIDSEPAWVEAEKQIFADLFGADANRLTSVSGLGIDSIYNEIIKLGLRVSRTDFHEAYHRHGPEIYRTAAITPGLLELGKTLLNYGFRIGIVSASPQDWIDMVVDRLPIKDQIDFTLSLDKHPNLHHKPAPDGYLYALTQLGALAANSVILEDSNTGIASAKAAKVYTIGLSQNLLAGYQQKGADAYASTLDSVSKIVTSFIQTGIS